MSGGEKVVLDPAAAARLGDLYRDDALELAGLVPSLDLALWPSVVRRSGPRVSDRAGPGAGARPGAGGSTGSCPRPCGPTSATGPAWRAPGDLGVRADPARPGRRASAPARPTSPCSVRPTPGSRWWLSLVADHPDVTPGHRSTDAANFFAPYCTEPFGPAETPRSTPGFPAGPDGSSGTGPRTGWPTRGSPRCWPRPHHGPSASWCCSATRSSGCWTDSTGRSTDRPPHPARTCPTRWTAGSTREQLTRLLECYPADQVCVLQYEQCVADPVGSLARTFGSWASTRLPVPSARPAARAVGHPGGRALDRPEPCRATAGDVLGGRGGTGGPGPRIRPRTVDRPGALTPPGRVPAGRTDVPHQEISVRPGRGPRGARVAPW